MEFSKIEWVSALNEALSGVFPEGATDPIVVQYVIEENSGEFFTYYLSLSDGEASMREGKAEQAPALEASGGEHCSLDTGSRCVRLRV